MAVCDNIINLSSSQATRVKLLGIGIVCGLEVFRDTQCYISITRGVGVTSTGHVICMSDKTFKYYKKYNDPNKYFHSLINCKNDKGAKKCELWELIQHREENATSIVPQNAASVDKPFLEDKVVLSYLEDEAKLAVRILLIEQSDMWEILKCGCILKTHCIPTEPKDEDDISIFDKDQRSSLQSDEELYHAVNKKYMLKEIVVRRFGYGQVDIGDLDLEDPEETNLNPGSDFFKEYEVIIDRTLKKLDDEIDKLHGFFGCMIDPCHCKEKDGGADDSPCNPVTPNSPTETGLQMHNIKIFKRYFTLINKKWGAYKRRKEPVQSIQYFYDFIKDLVKTYNELLHELYELMNECCPDTDCFPRHLMLGRIKEEVSFQPSIFRQSYLQPPVYNGNADRLQAIRFLHWRMVIMMKCFYIPDWELDDMSDESYFDVLKMENEKRKPGDLNDYLPVRITPSCLYSEALGKQAIPFYYNLSNSPYSLQYYWDYFATKHNREDNHLSYFCKEDPAYSQLTFVQHPFLYSIDQYSFFRIEGHTGMTSKDAMEAIANLKKRYRLCFIIITVSLSDLEKWLDKGAEHVAGVSPGGIFILINDGNKIVGDLHLPFGFTVTMPQDTVSPDDKTPSDKKTDEIKPDENKSGETPVVVEESWESVLKRIGKATKKDDLKKIAGIKGKTESILNKAGITAFSQLAKLTAANIPVMAKATGLDDIKEDWFKQAKKLVKNA
jgi:predicted flap endonuclease-1-like 5' DNA nuclease